jgi:PPOX class probable F420-dependent enzyme
MTAPAARALPDEVLALLRAPSPCFVTTLMPDGAPQTTQTWVDTDGDHILINTVVGFRKARNVARDPRVSVAVADATAPHRYAAIRGRVVHMGTEGAAEHIEGLAQKYLGGPYPWYGGRDQTRLILTIEAHSIHTIG